MRKILTIAFAMLALSATMAAAQDPVEVSPEVYTTLFENDGVRVLEMRLAAGAEDATHSHPTEVVYFLNEGAVTVTLPDGTVVEKPIAAGEVMYSEAWTHRVRNSGDAEVHAIIVELKSGQMAEE